MIGRKIYYDLLTGDVILVIPEKHHKEAQDTTIEQDFAVFTALSRYTPETIGLLQLAYGEHREYFEKAEYYRIDADSKTVLFHFPSFEPPYAEEIKRLKNENEKLKEEVSNLKMVINDLTLFKEGIDVDLRK